jgi:O-6-methylguanine DNA methyltransferase
MPTIFISHTGRTSLGDLWVAVNNRGLVAIEFPTSRADFVAWLKQHHPGCEINAAPDRTNAALTQIKEYIAGQRRAFTLPIDWSIFTDFQRLALKKVYAIPYGETRTYAEIAEQIKHPHAYRAVGRANATNPIPLVIPCHRVLGSDGKLHGYGAGTGLKTKEWLLKLEQGAL